MSRLFGFLSGVVLFLYPFAVFYGIEHFGTRPISVMLLALFLLRYGLQKRQVGDLKLNLLPLATGMGTVFAISVFIVDRAQLLKFYPVLMNLFFLILFAVSLKTPPPIIERLARFRHPELSPRGVRHTRQVTIAWCVFFVANGGIALYTALFADMKVWTLYNGFLSYVAMGLMFLFEYPLRRARMAQDAREAQEQCYV